MARDVLKGDTPQGEENVHNKRMNTGVALALLFLASQLGSNWLLTHGIGDFQLLNSARDLAFAGFAASISAVYVRYDDWTRLVPNKPKS